MSIKKEKISGETIELKINSSHLSDANYNILSETLIIGFKGQTLKYAYKKVPIDIFMKFKLSKSQGIFFNKYICRNFKFKILRSNK